MSGPVQKPDGWYIITDGYHPDGPTGLGYLEPILLLIQGRVAAIGGSVTFHGFVGEPPPNNWTLELKKDPAR